MIRHNHHPKQKHRSYNLKSKRRPPLLTNAIILQPSQRFLALPGRRADHGAKGADGIQGPVEKDGSLDKAGEPEDEEDEGAENNNSGE